MSKKQIDYIDAGNVRDYRINEARRMIIGDNIVSVFRLEDGFYAIEDTCPHAEASLTYGKLHENVIECPRHGAQFDIKTGKVLSLPATFGLRKFDVKIEDDVVFVARKPESEDRPEMLRLDVC